MDEVLNDAVEQGASDVDVIPGDYVTFTILGDINRQIKYGVITDEITVNLVQTIISHVLEADFMENLELDTSYTIQSGLHQGRRFRLSVGRTFSVPFLVFRLINDRVPTPNELGVPDEMLSWFSNRKGLILLNGGTGTGKSTTLASLLVKQQLERAIKIITVERPIEYIFGVKGASSVTQREVGVDCRSFLNALTSAVRQHPNIILIGEVRNQEEVDALLMAAETSHLTVSTMHTNSVPEMLNRLKNIYTGADTLRILSSLSDNLRGVANQILVKSKDGKSRFALWEYLTINSSNRELIQKGDVKAVLQLMRENKATLDDKLYQAVKQGRCTKAEALDKSTDREYFLSLF